MDNLSASFPLDSPIKKVRWPKLIDYSNRLTFFLVEFYQELVKKLSKLVHCSLSKNHQFDTSFILFIYFFFLFVDKT